MIYDRMHKVHAGKVVLDSDGVSLVYIHDRIGEDKRLTALAVRAHHDQRIFG